MRVIGIIGGMSWESTMPYYRRINELVRQRLGGLHSAKLVIISVDFAEVEEMQTAGRWAESGDLLASTARSLQAAGAECVLIATNTMHKVADRVAEAVTVPLLHIADAAGSAVVAAGLDTVGLLGTRFTMEEDFYSARLSERFGVSVLVPQAEERALVDAVIYGELCRGVISPESQAAFNHIIAGLIARGAQGIVLGCTEIPLLVRAEDVSVPVFDTGELHASAAVDFALAR